MPGTRLAGRRGYAPASGDQANDSPAGRQMFAGDHGYMSIVKAWQRYQRSAAQHFRALGMTADVDEPLDAGSKGIWNVDVAVRWTRAGVSLLWVIECKYWGTPITQEKVAALRTVVGDVGADRGILLAKSGAQSGAYQKTAYTNIFIATLAQLQASAQDELAEERVKKMFGEVAELEKYFKQTLGEVGALALQQSRATLQMNFGAWGGDELSVLAHLEELTDALNRTAAGSFPLEVTWRASDADRARSVTYANRIDASAGIDAAYDALSVAIIAGRRSVRLK